MNQKHTLLSNCIFYEVFVQSFADSNGDGIGDLIGLAQKLDYLQSMGIDALWLMPLHRSPSYHKYDVIDYFSIHEHYGTIADCNYLVDEAHKRNMYVFIDLVVNHTSTQHFWFTESKKGKRNKYRNFYIWSDNKELMAKEPKFWYSAYNENGNKIRGEKYYAFFDSGMPDLNYDNQAVRDEVKKIGAFWLGEMKIDGFRLDAAQWIYPVYDKEKNYPWWQEFRAAMEKINPDVMTFGEVWATAETIAPYVKGINSCFNFDLSYLIVNSLQAESDKGIIQKLLNIHKLYRKFEPEFIDSIFITNHDQNRVMSELKNSVEKAKLAASLLLTLPGIPFIYYGEEIGMRGEKPDEYIREPFIWSTDVNEKYQTRWLTPRCSTEKYIVPLSKQQTDDNSIFNHYKTLIALRKQHKALSMGVLEKSAIKSKKIISFYRQHNGSKLLVLHNISKKEFEIGNHLISDKLFQIFYSSSLENTVNQDVVSIKPYSTLILEIT